MIRVLFGEEPFLLDKEKKEFLGKGNGMAMIFSELSEDIWDCARQYPLLTEKNYIFVNCKSIEEKKLEKFVDGDMPEHTDIMIIVDEVDKRKTVYKKLNKLGFIEEVSKVSDRELQGFIVSLVKEAGREISCDAYEHFVSICGYKTEKSVNLYTIKNYIELLCMCPTIDRNTIDTFVTAMDSTNIFAMANCIFDGNNRRVFYLADKFLSEKQNVIAMLSALLRNFRLAHKATFFSDIDRSQLGKMIGVPVYQFERALDFSPEQIAKSMDIIQKGISNVKTGKGDANRIFIFTLSKIIQCLHPGIV